MHNKETQSGFSERPVEYTARKNSKLKALQKLLAQALSQSRVYPIPRFTMTSVRVIYAE